jgi:hypothetical protein
MYFITAPIDCSSSARQVNRMIPIIIIYCYVESRLDRKYRKAQKSVKMSSTVKSSTISRWTPVISFLSLVDVNLVTLKF